MDKLKDWVDRLTEQLCKWLNDFLPNDHALALAGHHLTGVRKSLLLPVDRRRYSNITKMAGQSRTDVDGRLIVNSGYFNKEQDCGFWAYCHMSGQPCVWCGGGNDIGAKTFVLRADGTKSSDPSEYKGFCPKGKVASAAWWGCCKGPLGESIVSFRDCCGHGYCDVRPWRICKNWPEAKNWCLGGSGGLNGPLWGGHSYYCTIVETIPGVGC